MWKHQADANPLTLALGVYRDADAVPGGTMFIPLAESDLVTTTPSSLNTFETRIPVTGGELFGLRLVTAGIGCRYLTGIGMDQDASQSPPPPSIPGTMGSPRAVARPDDPPCDATRSSASSSTPLSRTR